MITDNSRTVFSSVFVFNFESIGVTIVRASVPFKRETETIFNTFRGVFVVRAQEIG